MTWFARTTRLLYYWLPPVLWMGLMLWWSANAFRVGAPSVLLSWDKLAHAVYFGSVALLVMRALIGDLRWSLRYAATAAFLFTVLYGAWDEYRQGFDPARTRELGDFAADVAGALCVFAAAGLLRLRQRRSPTPASGRPPARAGSPLSGNEKV